LCPLQVMGGRVCPNAHPHWCQWRDARKVMRIMVISAYGHYKAWRSLRLERPSRLSYLYSSSPISYAPCCPHVTAIRATLPTYQATPDTQGRVRRLFSATVPDGARMPKGTLHVHNVPRRHAPMHAQHPNRSTPVGYLPYCVL
jgi:hypothetical protein